MENVRVLVVEVGSTTIGRKDLERIESESFETIDEVIEVLGSGDFEHYTLCDFMDLCNNSDSQTTKIDDWVTINIDDCWIGYINLNK